MTPFRWLAAAARLALPALLAGVAGAARAAEPAVLLASTAPGLTPGMVVAPSDPLVLPDGASLTLLLRSGQMLKLRGPLETSLAQAGPAPAEGGSAAALAAAFRLRGVDASVIGGARASATLRPRPRQAEVLVDTQRSATWCVGRQDSIWLARPAEAASQGEWALRRRGSLRRITWPEGAARIEWPGELTLEDGDRFDLLAGGAVQASFLFRSLPDTAMAEAALVAEGLMLGCREQFEPALRRLARALPAPELWLGSDRGRAPRYRPGEPIALTAMADSDGWLFCVAAREDGSVLPVFPAGAIDGARLPGGAAATLPGQRRSLALRAGVPGTEQLRCWLAERDISAELPPALLDASGKPLPPALAAGLDGLFTELAGARLARASLAIRVE